MSLLNKIKMLFPTYRTAAQMTDRINMLESCLNTLYAKVDSRIKELDEKNEYLFFLSQRLPGETGLDTRRRVYLDMPKATGNMRNIQLAENYILRRIKQICDENDISFFLSDGTLIGAERHHGFIPWDDDIDISMMRDEYEKFEIAIQNDSVIELKQYYCLFDKDNVNVINKVKLKNNNAFFVDVFVYDYIDCSSGELNNVWNSYNELSKQFHIEVARNLEKMGYTNFLIDGKYTPKSLSDFDDSYKKIYNSFRTAFNRIGHGEYFCLGFEVSNAFINKIKILECKHYLPLDKDCIEFEGCRYDCLRNHIDYLSIQYGNIWELPRSFYSRHLHEIGNIAEKDVSFLREHDK